MFWKFLKYLCKHINLVVVESSRQLGPISQHIKTQNYLALFHYKDTLKTFESDRNVKELFY